MKNENKPSEVRDGGLPFTLEFLRSVLDAFSAPSAVLDKVGNIISVNRAWKQFAEQQRSLGDAPFAVGENYLDERRQALGPFSTNAATACRAIRSVLNGSATQCTVDCRLDHGDQKRRFQVQVTLVPDQPSPYAMVIHHDMTEPLQTEELLRTREEQLRLLVQSVEDYAILMLEPSGVIRTWNIGAERLTGYVDQEAVGQSIDMLYPPKVVIPGETVSVLREAAERGRVCREGWLVRKDGQHFLAHCLTYAMHDQQENLLGFSRVIRDVTTQRRDEEASRSVMDHSVDAIFAIDLRGVIQSCGGAARKIFGYTTSELVGQRINLLMPEPWSSEHDGYISDYIQTGIAKVIGNVREVTGLRKDGATVPLELVVTEFGLNGGRFFTGVLRDVTDRKRLEAQLRQSQKMDAIGQLAGGIAHDFNNLLTVIMGFSEEVLSSLPENDSHAELLAEVVKAGERAAELTKQLLAFSRKQILMPVVLNLNGIVTNCEKFLRRLIGPDVYLVSVCAPDLRSIKADPNQLEQVIINLAVNARDAMPGGGTLTIATCNRDLDVDQCVQYPGCRPGRYVVLSLTDTGCGMTTEVRARIFEPFFTTKEVGRGTGLGLAMVYGIVKQSDGFIVVQSTVGVGTSFTILLPAVSGVPIQTERGLEQNPTGRSDETVLLVDDEAGVRKLARHILESQGYHILEASGGQEALSIEQAHRGKIHLLIVDVVMRELSGWKLVDIIHARNPDLKVLYISGYADDESMQNGIIDKGYALLQKPYASS